jgi:hypothetical protein
VGRGRLAVGLRALRLRCTLPLRLLALAGFGLAPGDARQHVLQFPLILLDGAHAPFAAVDVLLGLCQQLLTLGTGACKFRALLLKFALARRDGRRLVRDLAFALLEGVELLAQLAKARRLRTGHVLLVAQQAGETRRILLAQQ